MIKGYIKNPIKWLIYLLPNTIPFSSLTLYVRKKDWSHYWYLYQTLIIFNDQQKSYFHMCTFTNILLNNHIDLLSVLKFAILFEDNSKHCSLAGYLKFVIQSVIYKCATEISVLNVCTKN